MSSPCLQGVRTGSVHGKVEVFDVSKAAEYFAKVCLGDIFGQFLDHDLNGATTINDRLSGLKK